MSIKTIDHIQLTKNWIEHLVIGLNLCPFAKSPFNKNTIRYVVVENEKPEDLRQTFLSELLKISETPSEEIETTLIIHPNCLVDFHEYLDFLEAVNQLIDSSGMSGIIQVASFHPAYQFGDTQKDDVENYTNRSPFPMLHLLREDSIEKALVHYPNPEGIPEQNIKTMNQLGLKEVTKILKQGR